ncbi:MAG: Asp-tRNA(Asn)/Glu-tRNA(Gln) amidotransferase subunit GatB [Deltaproteobacteria bacterium]|nr:Asp-tRNA(Asn)/Glu-tRNA(Gln) amidotransferase subunit GatB [Deltaproteobacteria bacterium]
MDFDVIIGFETHVELKTDSKLFCDCPVDYDALPNTLICPVCTGQPGALPVLNKKAVEYTVRAGLALKCTVNRLSRFARKNYFYPDLPKGYQISQYDKPFCEEGRLEITSGDGQPYAVGIKRVHLEEDAGKLVHSSDSFEASEFSLVDYNRSCVPLLEIVTDHEKNPLRSTLEARAYLEKLRQTLRYIEVSDCNMEKGQLRCDVNISLRPKGSKAYGNRSEIKNMASFKAIGEALEYEIARQRGIIEGGGEIFQETRLFDEAKHLTLPMRSKEDAPDYRYFPDPDLLEIELPDDFVDNIRRSMPELPDQSVDRLVGQYNLPKEDALLLTRDKRVAGYFSACALFVQDRQRLSRWIIKDLFRLLKKSSLSIAQCPVPPEGFSELVNAVTRDEITEKMGRQVLEEMFERGVSAGSVIAEKDLKPIRDLKTLERLVDEVIAENLQVTAKIREGSTKPMDYLIGQVMKKTRGKANPKELAKLIQEKLLG